MCVIAELVVDYSTILVGHLIRVQLVNQIRQWIREERLQFTDDSDIGIECENCGASIKTGRFCENCKNTMANNLSSAIEKPKPAPEEPKKKAEPKNKMHFLEK